MEIDGVAYDIWSLSARRAWIEITEVSGSNQSIIRSLSARRAWIEIALLVYLALIRYVALRKESVDRNTNFLGGAGQLISRSPQGERG